MREKEKSTTIIYLRHGKTDYPLDRLYCDDKENPPLSALGRRQAEQAASVLQHINIDSISTSPTMRTRDTAQIVSAACNVPMSTIPEFTERHFGNWEGLYFKDIEQKYPKEYKQWKNNPADFRPQGGENMTDLQLRLENAFSSLFEQNTNKTALLVTHVGVIRACVGNALQMPLEMHRQLRVDHASLTRIDYGTTKINLIYFNYLSDLPI